ncbi:MAG: glycosyltransferase [Pseudomonadota bacterium]
MVSLSDLTVMVKSFMRPDILGRFLLSAGQYQNQRGVQFGCVLVGDDSDADTKKEIEEIVEKAREQFPDLKIVYLDLEFYLGCSEGRNRMIDVIETKYFLYCDDDYIFDAECEIEECVQLADERNLDVLSGWWKNYPELSGDYHVQNFVGHFDLSDPDCVNCYMNVHELFDFRYADYHTNYYVGRTDTIRKLKWESTLKTEEHPEFFYRAYKAKLNMAFTNKLFIAHNHPKNSPKYEAFRSVNSDAGRKALYHRLDVCGVKKWNAYYFGVNTIRQWTVDREKRTSTNYSYNLSKAAIEARDTDAKTLSLYNQKVPIERLTPEFEHHFFGYYDIKAADESDTYHLALRVPFIDRQPTAEDMAELRLIDQDGNIEVLDTLNTWNFQQGAFAQFRPGHRDEIIYNTYDHERFAYRSVARNIKTGDTEELPMPLANVSADGKWGLGLNFSRLFDYRPGYGYSNIIDPFFHEVAPHMDGLWLVDLTKKETSLLVSYRSLWEQFFEGTKWENDKVIINHANFSPSGTKIFALLRVFSDSAPFPTLSVVIDAKTGEAKQVFGFGSHYHWRNDSEIIVSGEDIVDRSELTGMSLYHINVDTGEVAPVDTGFFKGDGHCTFSPDGRYVLYDSYCSVQVPYRKLQIYDMVLKKGTTLFHAYSDPLLYNEDNDCRCDLHPRWSPSGEYISFDSLHERFRGSYRIKTSDAIKVLNQEMPGAEQVDINGEAIMKEAELVNHVRRSIKPKAIPPAGKSAPKAKKSVKPELVRFNTGLEWIEKAKGLFEEGNHSMALSVINAAELTSGRIAKLHSVMLLKSKIYHEMGDAPNALQLAEVLVKESPTNEKHLRHLRNLYNLQGEYEAAIHPAMAATLVEAGGVDDLLYLALLFHKVGRVEDALAAVREASALDPDRRWVFESLFDEPNKPDDTETALKALVSTRQLRSNVIETLLLESDRRWILSLVQNERSKKPLLRLAKPTGPTSELSLHDLARLAKRQKIAVTPPDSFDERAYLRNNPDVAAEVDAGGLGSGFEHYTLFGHLEDRQRPGSI